jgi:hypothetical protein
MKRKQSPIENKIKQILIALAIGSMICWNLNCFGQDTIFKNNGTFISGKVIEISGGEVRYKKPGNVDGPTYIEYKSELSSISYKNGFKDTFKFEKPWFISADVKKEEKPLKEMQVYKKDLPEIQQVGSRFSYNGQLMREREMHHYLLSLHDPAISDRIQKSRLQKGLQYIGFAAIPLGIASMVYFIDGTGILTSQQDNVNSQNAGKLLGLAGIACISTSIILKMKRKNNNTVAIKLYQQKY